MCDDNSRTRSVGSSITLNAECLYQEVAAQQGDNLDLVCDARSSNFTSAQLSWSDQSFRVLRSATDTTNGDKILRVNSGTAPGNTHLAVATIYSNGRATLSCSLSAPDPVPSPSPQPTPTTTSVLTTSTNSQTAQVITAGPCIDSDNDGFGWNGVATCRVGSAQSNQRTTSTSVANQATTPVSASSNTQSQTTPGIEDLTDLILVTGQSNAQGAESDVSLAVLDAPNNKVFAFTDESGWQVADLRQHWDGPNQVRHPGNNNLIFPTNTPHNNFALHFGKSLVALDSRRVVGFVLATSPGAGIRQWRRGSSFYNSLTNKALTALNASNKTSFDGILWHQGETDFLYNGTADANATASEKVAPNYYPDELSRLINNLRQEPWFSTTTPVFICGETQKTSSNPAPVNRRLLALNNDNDRHTGCVNSDGLQTIDGTHFDAAALREIGRRYANKYIELNR